MVLILAVTGCKKFVHVGEPDDSLTTTAVFSNDSLAQAAVTGLYIKIMSSTRFLLNGGMSLFPGLSADELQRTSSLVNEDPFFNNAINSTNLLDNVNLWKAAYAYIYQCNICIEGLQKSTGISAGIKTQLQGEVLFVRALCYFYLVNLYGDVPLALSTNADVNTMLSRSSVDEVYQQIETDLSAANDILVDDKPNTTPTKYAARALLARVYLYRKNWSKAEDMASAVIESKQFALGGDLARVFRSDSKETIFQLAPVADRMNSGEGFIFVQSSPTLRPNYNLTTGLLNSFEPGDLRKINWVKTVTLSQQTYNYPYKYRVYLSSTISEYNIVLRLAEQYLIRAEAKAYQNKIEDAVIDINTIRIRAGLPVLSTTISYDECLQRIEQERRIELFAEWGHRWFDLKRTNRANVVLSVVKGSNWQTEDQLYPVPSTELEIAPNLKQNPGYD